MEQNFKTKVEEDYDDHLEIGEVLIKVRKELTECAQNEGDMSKTPQLLELIEFNDKNKSKLDEIERLAKEQISDLISESSGFESVCGDSVCDSWHSSDEDNSDDEDGKR